MTAKIELKDQFNKPHLIAFPHEKPCVLAVADEQGAKQLNSWVEPIHKKFGEQIEIHGLADVTGVPRLIQPLIARQFRKQYPQPVLLDWDGKSVAQFGYAGNEALVLVIDRTGEIRHRVTGMADAKKLEEAFTAIAGTKP